MKRIQAFLRNENVITVSISIISFCVYLATMCRSVGFTDSGELATVACTLGIAHPTGYPLFTLLGRCWLMIPVPLEEILRLNVFSAFLTSLAVGVFFKTALVLHQSTAVFQFRSQKRNKTHNHRFIVASAIASLVLGFSTTFWSQSTAIEVYALHLVLVFLTIGTFIRGLEEQLTEQNYISRTLFLFAFVLGLSFSNHMTTILLAPGFLWLYFRTFGFTKASFNRILKIAPFFLLGLSIYLYLPVRSSRTPLLDWGHPATLERLFWHVSGKQFRVWMFSGWSVVQKQLNYYVGSFTSEFFFLLVVCIVTGFAALFRQSRRMLVFFAFLFFTTILYSVNYDIFDIGSYFLLSYIVIGWIIAYGIDFLFSWTKNKQPFVRVLVIALLFVLPLTQVVNNWKNVDETKNAISEQFVKNAFSRLEPNAIVLASQWDYFISPSLYYQFIQHERRDITVIDKSLLQNRTWYFMQLEHQAPWLMKRVREQENLFHAELNKFERGEPFEFAVIQARWQNLMAAIVELSLPDHPVYIDARISQEFSSQYQRIPAGLFLRLTKLEDITCYRTAVTPFPEWNTQNPVIKDLQEYYLAVLAYEADWLLKKERFQEAKIVLAEILHINPQNYSAAALMRQLK